MTDVKEIYNQIYGDDKPTFSSGKPDELAKDILEYKQGGSMLEIGADDGRNSLFLAAQGFSVEAIDISDKGIFKLTESAKKQSLSVKAWVADINTFIPEKSYDIILSTFVLHHLLREKALSIIKLIKDKTSSGGLNALATFTKEGDFYRDKPDTDNFYPNKEELKDLYSDWEILKYTEKQGRAFKTKKDSSPAFNISAKLLAIKI